MKLVSAAVVLMTIIVASGHAQAAGVLSESEVRDLVAGKTLEGKRSERQEMEFDPGPGDAHGEKVLLYFSMEGRVVGKIGNNDKSGQWSVSDTGGLCLQWEGGESKCAPVQKEGSVYERVSGDSAGMSIMVFTFSGVADGNVYGLKQPDY